jgi:hypothetical protein
MRINIGIFYLHTFKFEQYFHTTNVSTGVLVVHHKHTESYHNVFYLLKYLLKRLKQFYRLF